MCSVLSQTQHGGGGSALTYTTRQPNVCLQNIRLGCVRCLLLDPGLHPLSAYVLRPTHVFTDTVEVWCPCLTMHMISLPHANPLSGSRHAYITQLQ